MATILDLQTESLRYTARFARPPFELWGQGGRIVGGLYDALKPYNVTLRNIQVSGSVPTAADVVVTVQLGSTVLKISFERIEIAFAGFTEEEFNGIPQFIQTATGWIQKDYAFASHEAFYFSHSFLKAVTTDEFLKTISPNPIKSAGTDLGTGMSFYRSVPEKHWMTRLTLDRSQSIAGGLYIGLDLAVASGTVDYASLLSEGRAYFINVIGELGLALPSDS